MPADPSRDEQVRAHISAIATRSASDADRLTTALGGRAWPGGNADRSDPFALRWLRGWRPNGPAPLPLPCACASGRCLVCN